jgi:hypothetical protein
VSLSTLTSAANEPGAENRENRDSVRQTNQPVVCHTEEDVQEPSYFGRMYKIRKRSVVSSILEKVENVYY